MSKTFDLTTLGLTGTHTITVKARASGYRDSPASDAVSYVVAGEETYTVSGTWRFNDVPNPASQHIYEICAFTTESGYRCAHITISDSAATLYRVSFNAGGKSGYEIDRGWDRGCQVITFDGVQTVSKVFYDWFKANAVQKLAAPRISIPEENILLIEQGDGNANTYSIRIDGTQKDTQNAPNDSTPLSYNISKLGLSAGNYITTVVATAEGYMDSDSSNEQPIKVVESGKTHSGGSN